MIDPTEKNGAPGEIRTPDRLVRRQVLDRREPLDICQDSHPALALEWSWEGSAAFETSCHDEGRIARRFTECGFACCIPWAVRSAAEGIRGIRKELV